MKATSTPKQEPVSSLPAFMIVPMARFCRGPQSFSREAEKHDPSSRTIPDDSFSIKELFDRFQRGAPLPIGLERPISYSENPDHNDLDTSKIAHMDLSEVSDLTKRVSDTLYFLNDRKSALIKEYKDLKTGDLKGVSPLPNEKPVNQ